MRRVFAVMVLTGALALSGSGCGLLQGKQEDRSVAITPNDAPPRTKYVVLTEIDSLGARAVLLDPARPDQCGDNIIDIVHDLGSAKTVCFPVQDIQQTDVNLSRDVASSCDGGVSMFYPSRAKLAELVTPLEEPHVLVWRVEISDDSQIRVAVPLVSSSRRQGQSWPLSGLCPVADGWSDGVSVEGCVDEPELAAISVGMAKQIVESRLGVAGRMVQDSETQELWEYRTCVGRPLSLLFATFEEGKPLLSIDAR